MKFKLIFPALLAVAFNAGAMSCAVGGADAPPKFMVSVLLQKPGDDVTIKHGPCTGDGCNARERDGARAAPIKKTFPDVVNTLATRVDSKDPTCGAPASTSRQYGV